MTTQPKHLIGKQTGRKPRKVALMTDRQIDRLKTIPVDYRAVTVDAYEHRSLPAAIKAKCLDCSNWQRNEIRLCTVETCSLWPWRPYQNATP